MAERDRLELGELVAALGAAQQGRELVADEPAAAAGKDLRPPGGTRPLLLVAGGESFGSATFRSHGAADHSFVATGRFESGGGREET